MKPNRVFIYSHSYRILSLLLTRKAWLVEPNLLQSKICDTILANYKDEQTLVLAVFYYLTITIFFEQFNFSVEKFKK
jgi:hypothetical protein